MLERILLGDRRVKEAQRQGREEEGDLATRADQDKAPDESLEQTMDKLRLESRKQQSDQVAVQ